MSFRMTLGGSKEEKHHGIEHYAEGYNAGYNSAVEEMRRKTRSYADDFDIENRRGRTRGFAEPLHNGHYPVEDRRGGRSEHEQHYPSDNVHWPVEARQIGFAGEPSRSDMRHVPQHNPVQHDAWDRVMDMLHEVKEGQEHIKQGMAATKKLDPRLDGVLESATRVLENPPSTWAQYQHRKDFAGIAKMEGKELLAALEARKPIQDIRKELTHTIAALFQLVSAS